MANNSKKNSGVTLIEVAVTLFLLTVVIIGAIRFRYYSALDVRNADAMTCAARLGSMFLEAWKGTGGRLDYDPIKMLGSKLTISADAPGPAGLTNLLGHYHVDIDNENYYVTLSYENNASATPEVLNVGVAWMYNYEIWDDSKPYKSVKLTEYAGSY